MRVTARTAILRTTVIALSLGAAVLSTACIESQTRATIVLEPDGSGRWIVLQHDVHAVADTPDDRLREEQEFLAKAHAGMHDQAAGFRSVGATDIKTQILSSDWPFTVQTEARFGNLADVFSRLLDAAGADGRATLTRDADRMTFTAVVMTGDDTDGAGHDAEGGAGAVSLFGDPGPVVFLRHGRFVSATGFTISGDGRMAKANETDDKEPVLTLSLTWTTAEATRTR